MAHSADDVLVDEPHVVPVHDDFSESRFAVAPVRTRSSERLDERLGIVKLIFVNVGEELQQIVVVARRNLPTFVIASIVGASVLLEVV